MRKLIHNILTGQLEDCKELLDQHMKNLIDEKLNQVKIRLTAEMYHEIGVDVDVISEANVMKTGRTKLIRVRVRGGKVQRRIKKSNVPGFVLRGGKLQRMSSLERRHRKLAARKSRFKRRAKLQQSLRKRKMSLRKRHAMGIK